MNHRDRRSKIAGEIRAELARQDRSAAELGQAIGLSPATVSRILAGKRPVGFEELETIATFLGFPLAELISRTDAA